jgi:8-oxo-dGTP pyrophosphatase MutT (NUDIX family)
VYWHLVKSTKKALKNLPVSAKVIVMSKDSKALVLRKDKGIPDLPGGKVENGEDLLEALHREMEEEVQLSAKKFDFVASWVKHHPVLGDRLMIVFETQLKKKAKNIDFKLSDEHVWGKFLDQDGVEEIGDLQPAYLNALQICFSRYGKPE